MHTIMIVDDQKDIGHLVGTLLRYAGHQSVWVEDGRKALELISHAPPNLVLLDIMMPNMSGFEVLEELRSDEAHNNLRVVMLTAVADAAMQEKARKLGANDYLVKGSDWDEMLVRIERQLKCA